MTLQPQERYPSAESPTPATHPDTDFLIKGRRLVKMQEDLRHARRPRILRGLTVSAASLLAGFGLAVSPWGYPIVKEVHFTVAPEAVPSPLSQDAVVDSTMPQITPSPSDLPTSSVSIDPSPSPTPTSSPEKTKSPKPSETPSASSVADLPSPRVEGMSAIYYGYSEKKVQQMESCGVPKDKVLLTFDDYGTPERVQSIVDALDAKNAGAIFFPVKDQFSQARVDALRQDGFWVGDHTKDHANLHKLSKAEIKKEYLGGHQATLIRPPYGATYSTKDKEIRFDNRAEEVATELGARICMWTIDTRDWDGTSKKDMVKNVREHATGGSVVLMHMHGEYTPESVRPIINAIEDKGLKVCGNPGEPTTADIPKELPCS